MTSNVDVLKMFFTTFVMYLPALLINLVAVMVCLAKWRQAPSGSLWAIMGFGLGLLLCFVMPIGQTAIQYWAFQSGGSQAGRMWAFSIFAIIGSMLHAVIYGLLLVAVFAGRSKPTATTPPSLFHS
ncbi:MAG: hypothetical protein WCJ02_02865 [bacterium]